MFNLKEFSFKEKFGMFIIPFLEVIYMCNSVVNACIANDFYSSKEYFEQKKNEGMISNLNSLLQEKECIISNEDSFCNEAFSELEKLTSNNKLINLELEKLQLKYNRYKNKAITGIDLGRPYPTN